MIFLLLVVDDSVNAKTLRVKLASFIMMMTEQPNPGQSSHSVIIIIVVVATNWRNIESIKNSGYPEHYR
jgi:hypothetical protein